MTAGLPGRELGGRAYAQGLAALATGAGTFGLLSGHLLLTSSIDLCVWVVVTWLVVRVLRTGDERLWLVAGVVDLYGPARGLPPAWSGHNAYGLWGRPRKMPARSWWSGRTDPRTAGSPAAT